LRQRETVLCLALKKALKKSFGKMKEFWLTLTRIYDYNLVSSLAMERISTIKVHEQGVSIINS